MKERIRVAICGYGNLGRGVEKALSNPANRDMELVAIFTRRDPLSIKPVTPVEVVSINQIEHYKDKIDVVVLCGGSAKDLPEQGPMIARMFNTVDSFDTHAKIPEYHQKMYNASFCAGKVSIIRDNELHLRDCYMVAEEWADFISEKELQKNQPHGGLESNLEFIGSIFVAYAREAFYLNERGEVGARTVFDVPVSLLTAESAENLVRRLL